MKYDEEMMVELVAAGGLSHGEIAERLGVSRRTVWRIANGLSRPDLQKKIAAVAEGYRQAAIRQASRHMGALLEKQVEVALSGDGETARKSREFLLKTFVTTLPEQAAKSEEAEEKQIEKADAANPKTEAPKVTLGPSFLDMLGTFSEEVQRMIMDEIDMPRPNYDEEAALRDGTPSQPDPNMPPERPPSPAAVKMLNKFSAKPPWGR